MKTHSNLHDILREAIFTEQSTIQSEKNNAYTFRVASRANKIEIKKAIEQAFDVKVKHVRTMMVRGNNVVRWTRGGWVSGRTSIWKKAIVTLEPGFTIDFV